MKNTNIEREGCCLVKNQSTKFMQPSVNYHMRNAIYSYM